MKNKVSFPSALMNSLVLLFFIGVCLFASVFNIVTGWQLVYFCCLLSIFCLFSILPPISNLKLKRQEHKHFLRADDRYLTVGVQTKTGQKKFYPHLSVELQLKDEWYEMTLQEPSSFVSNQWHFSLEIEREFERGVYQNLPIRLKTSDIFKLFRKQRTLTSELAFSVMPILEIGRAKEVFVLLAQHRLIPSPDTRVSSFDIKNLRNYREGDQYGKIDWKLSAKKQRFIVKELEVEFDNEGKKDVILLFFGQQNPKFESLLAIFFSFYLEHKAKFDEQDILLVDEESSLLQPASGEIFAKIKPLNSGRVGLEIVRKARVKGYKIVVFTPEITKKVVILKQELDLLNEVSVISLTDFGELLYS